jgi:hypothetical protein
MTMTTDAGRLVLHCNRCPVRLDLGPYMAATRRNRTPSGWVNLGGDHHVCPSCSPGISLAALVMQARENRPQPLV